MSIDSEFRLSIIAAVAENGVIGRSGQLPWRLSADLQRFKRLTMGHAIIMGRKTYESINRLLPGRQTVVITAQQDWQLPGGQVCHDFEAALDLTREDAEPFVIGGASVYRQAWPRAGRLYLTRVEAEVEGDVRFPEIDWDDWERSSSERFEADERNEFPHRFEVYVRQRPPVASRAC